MEKDEKDERLDGVEDELVRELLDDESPLFVIQSKSRNSEEDATHPLIYSGPRIEDIDNALSVKTWNCQSQTQHRTRFNSVLERGSPKIQNNAKKQVERPKDDQDTLIVTYEGFHLHFAYPYFPVLPFQDDTSPTKKANMVISEAESSLAKETQEIATANYEQLPSSIEGLPQEMISQQGLLEDMVPWMIRNPSHKKNIASIASSCSSSNYSPSPPASPSQCLGLPMF
ncbi:hypothetical protein F3Y22_tig00113145pilonHSYRG00119 [Hibiscus syriacus]|uniref:Uncharacterized protein n=1 Tax=Hibiscus syriacus TaxID=106335 RepID=A0A6A2X2K7_HIBSY|nr:hypothetical protein F3Y22_tig00113145pilonHSYRG00119 [Hibiscus syriacus]